ncbi:hypothetical protein P43SY_006422 [Pythium insidiosum]|uniref:HECT-type E3 ubiquitin transferase n=1 Tax=Pythium insidiosum TaxID=114742 RepID=A0AAD5LPC1_PYTIN|nr:hypothetical protein P43SY_006422 [Pythium insidiosum]
MAVALPSMRLRQRRSGATDRERRMCEAHCRVLHRRLVQCAPGGIATCGECLAGFIGASFGNQHCRRPGEERRYREDALRHYPTDDMESSNATDNSDMSFPPPPLLLPRRDVDSGDGDGDERRRTGGRVLSMNAIAIIVLGSVLALLLAAVARRTWREWREQRRRRRLQRQGLHRAFAASASTCAGDVGVNCVCAACLHASASSDPTCALCGSELTGAMAVDVSTQANEGGAWFAALETPRPALESDGSQRPGSRRRGLCALDAARERLELKRCVGSDGRVRWIRVDARDVLARKQLRGTFVTARDVASAAVTPLSCSSFIARAEPTSGRAWRPAQDVVLPASQFKPSVKRLLRTSRLPFPLKLQWFLRESLRLSDEQGDCNYTIHIHREHLLKQSMQLFLTAPPLSLRRHLRVDFMAEPGQDGGGILREWLQLVCHELFAESLGLFVQTSTSAEPRYWINRNAARTCRSHLEMFNFAGRLVGKALLDGFVLTARLALPLLKHLLGVPLSLRDLQSVDEQLYASVSFVLEHEDVEELALTFAIAGHELEPSGATLAVTAANRHRYVDRLMQFYLFESVDTELRSMLDGLRSVLPDTMLHVFDPLELDLVLSGRDDIDVADWRQHCSVRLVGRDELNEQRVVSWFWETMSTWPQRDRRRLLQYVTGSSGVPVEGFAGLTGADGLLQPFTLQLIEPLCGASTVLPYACTCMNRLDLPMYETKDELQQKLRLLIDIDVTGFNRQ